MSSNCGEDVTTGNVAPIAARGLSTPLHSTIAYFPRRLLNPFGWFFFTMFHLARFCT